MNDHQDSGDQRVARLYDLLKTGERPDLERQIMAMLANGDAADLESVRHLLMKPDRVDTHPESGHSDGATAEKTAMEGPEPGDTIGPFQIEKRLAKGGMGTVYLAFRTGNPKLKVALKLLSWWHPQMVDLFHAECKTLSGLKHPGIVPLIDAGTGRDGQPWMAMEYVSGMTLDVWLTQTRPDLGRRLEVFLNICDALSYAHRQMIIHRDLKPGNVLVTADGQTRLVDFGIASVLDSETGEQQVLTRMTDRRLTPEYASPEQINGLRLSAASDVYSLGILLYEMLTGVRPYRFETKNPDDIIRTINHKPISRPSQVRGGSETAKTFATRLRGDLDTIILKALERSITHRYPSVEALATDLRLYLEGLPIGARPAGLGYRIGKFARRKPWAPVMGGLLMISLLSFSLYAHRQGRLVAAERDIARKEQQTAEAVTRFLLNLFEQVDPDAARSGEPTAFEILESGRQQIKDRHGGQSEVTWHLLTTMGTVYQALDRNEPALALQEQALQLENTPEQRATLLMSMASAEQKIGRLDRAEEHLALLKEHLEQKPDDKNVRARYLHALGRQRFLQGRYRETEDAWSRAEESGALSEEQQAALSEDQAWFWYEWANLERAIQSLRQVLNWQITTFGEQHSRVLRTRLLLARWQVMAGNANDANDQFERVEALLDDDPDNDLHRAGLLDIHALRARIDGDPVAARHFYLQALAIRKKILGEKHADLAENLIALARYNEGDPDAAETYYQEALAVLLEGLGEKHARYVAALHQYGLFLMDDDRLDAAETVLRQAYSGGALLPGRTSSQAGADRRQPRRSPSHSGTRREYHPTD